MDNLMFVKTLRKLEHIFVILLFLGGIAAIIVYFEKLFLGWLLGLFMVFLYHWYRNIGKGDVEIEDE